ncbi:MAG: 16S rRNA (guanine(527)-N(7))-methyltransferase RsmG [Clostridiaceae bacterium]|jgi:16S rRNA (guanine527-N7)-methyltransferase|nr:16S rRNA (guanine(527)-N(7))-methyltransferase RsmG [Clostridiaceae bacterium]
MNPADMTLADWLDRVGELSGEIMPLPVREQMATFIQMLQAANRNINLTAIADDEGIAIRHILDSMTLLPLVDKLQAECPQPISLVDVGTGAGFPGMPLKLLRPACSVVLLDALAKRLRFLDTVIEQLRLDNIRTWHGRAEDAGREDGLRGRFDLAVARAVAPLNVLAEYGLPLVRTGGLFVAMKGRPESEWPLAARAVKILGGELEDIRQFTLPGTDMQRSLFCLRKVRTTPNAYPRKAGKAEKQPL